MKLTVFTCLLLCFATPAQAEEPPVPWSPPLAPRPQPVSAKDNAPLPPPQIRRPGSTPTAALVPSVPLPGFAGPSPSVPAAPGSAASSSAASSAPAAATSVPPTTVPPVGAAIVAISKQHNVPDPSGGLALHLNVAFEVQAQVPGAVYVAVWFSDAQTGERLRSQRAACTDESGNLSAQTRPSAVSVGRQNLRATLQIPYAAFPRPQAGTSRTIHATVQVLPAGSGAHSVALAETSTTFRVHASP